MAKKKNEDAAVDEKIAAVRKKFEAKTEEEPEVISPTTSKPRRRRVSANSSGMETRVRRNSAMDGSFRDRKVKRGGAGAGGKAGGHGKKKKPPVVLEETQGRRRSSGGNSGTNNRRRSSGAKYAQTQTRGDGSFKSKDEIAAEEVDVDRTTMWCTAWVGGIPAEFVKNNVSPQPFRALSIDLLCCAALPTITGPRTFGLVAFDVWLDSDRSLVLSLAGGDEGAATLQEVWKGRACDGTEEEERWQSVQVVGVCDLPGGAGGCSGDAGRPPATSRSILTTRSSD